MSYENAPATRMLASNCCACGKALVDAASVAAGMGPECRTKYGVGSLDEATRTEANALIYKIALHQEGAEVATCLVRLRELGLHTLADRIVKRVASSYVAVITAEAQGFAVKASFDVAMAANLGRVYGRRWDKDRKVNTFPTSAKRDVFEALRNVAGGGKCLGPKGEFTL